ncbi:MAG: hypothetical protein R3A45_11980 [Bdellovibrionota bacterium]
MAQTLVIPEQQPQQDPKQLQKEAMQAETQERISANDGPKQPTRLNESSGDEGFPSLAQSQTEIAGDKASFQPSDRNYSETEKKALSGDLSRETPGKSFVINNDESDALEQYQVERTQEKKKNYDK